MFKPLLRRALRVAAAACALTAIAAPIAHAAPRTLLVSPDGQEQPQPYQAWVDSSLVATASPRVTLIVGDECGGRSGYTPAAARDLPTVRLLVGCRDERYIRWNLLHELGHDFDSYALSYEGRQEFTAQTGTWNHERFAQAFALCALGPEYREFAESDESDYDYRPTTEQHEAICARVRRDAPQVTPAPPVVRLAARKRQALKMGQAARRSSRSTRARRAT